MILNRFLLLKMRRQLLFMVHVPHLVLYWLLLSRALTQTKKQWRDIEDDWDGSSQQRVPTMRTVVITRFIMSTSSGWQTTVQIISDITKRIWMSSGHV